MICGSPRSSIRRFEGFRSRWTTPFAWAKTGAAKTVDAGGTTTIPVLFNAPKATAPGTYTARLVFYTADGDIFGAQTVRVNVTR